MDKLKQAVKNDLWIMLLDVVAVNAAYFFALCVRLYLRDHQIPYESSFFADFYRFAPFYTLFCLAAFYACHLYGGIWRYAGVNDMNHVIIASAVTSAFQVSGTMLFDQRMPLLYYFIGGVVQFLLVAAIRFAYRIMLAERVRLGGGYDRAMVVGANGNGRQVVRLLEAGIAIRPACLLDCDGGYSGKSLDGLPVYQMDQFEKAIEKHDVRFVFIAEADLDAAFRKRIVDACRERGMGFRDYSSFFTFSGEGDTIAGMMDAVKGPAASGGARSIPFSPPDIGENEVREVAEALGSGWITTGPRTKLLERRLAAFVETGRVDVDTESDAARWNNRVVCLSSATAAEELNLRILGVREGDEVIVPAYTYTATASAAVHCGATVRFVDVQGDGSSLTGAPEADYGKLEKMITEKTKAVILVDFGGIACDYEKAYEAVNRAKGKFAPLEPDGTLLGDLSSRIQRALGRAAVLADGAHSLGASRAFHGEKARSGAIADFTSFSFHAVKNFTTAEGGAAMWRKFDGVDDAEIYRAYQLLSLHGQSKDALSKTNAGAWEYDVVGPWYKANMTDVSAAIGLRQLDRYPGLLERRREIVAKYDAACDELGLWHLKHFAKGSTSSGHLYVVRIPGADVAERNRVIEKMGAAGVATNVHYKPLPMMTAYKAMGADVRDFPNAYGYYRNLITLPLHTLLSDDDVDYVCESLKAAIEDVCGASAPKGTKAYEDGMAGAAFGSL